MILNIYQTKTNLDMVWDVRRVDGEKFAIGKAPFKKGQFDVWVTYHNNQVQRLHYNPYDRAGGATLKERFSFKVFEGEAKTGSLVGQTKKTGFLSAYAYYEFQKDGKMFYGYEVGFGRKGLYLCLYDGDKLAAIIQKQLKVKDFKDNYTAYFLDEGYADAVVLFTIYYDLTSYGDVLKIRMSSVSHKCVYTKQKEVLEKYDPAFIEAVIKKDFPREEGE